MLRTLVASVLLVGGLSSILVAQELRPRRTPSVTMADPAVTTVTRGKSGTVQLDFRITSGFHVNSNKPSSPLLIPTALKLTAPTDIVVGRTTYPPGEERSFPFSPNEKLSVYGGPFSIKVSMRPLVSVVPGKYAVHGTLRYQACDNATCYPPKELPVDFQIRVVKNAAENVHRNPAQCPHAHR